MVFPRTFGLFVIEDKNCRLAVTKLQARMPAAWNCLQLRTVGDPDLVAHGEYHHHGGHDDDDDWLTLLGKGSAIGCQAFAVPKWRRHGDSGAAMVQLAAMEMMVGSAAVDLGAGSTGGMGLLCFQLQVIPFFESVRSRVEPRKQ